MKDVKWHDSMRKEIDALKANNMWIIIDLPPKKELFIACLYIE